MVLLVVTQLHRQSGLNESVWEYQCQGSLCNVHCSITHCSHIPAHGSVNTPTRQTAWCEYVCKLLVQCITLVQCIFMLLSICRYRSLFCFNSVMFTPQKLVFSTTLAG